MDAERRAEKAEAELAKMTLRWENAREMLFQRNESLEKAETEARKWENAAKGRVSR